ncbi:MAG: hypothetical protein ACJZ7Z_02490 [Myxococcota bacterium]
MQVIECAGHPRDLGFAQGAALRKQVKDQADKAGLPVGRSRWPSLHPFVKGPVRGRGASREMIRHYTHLAERVDGLARGSALPVDSIFDLQLEAHFEETHVMALGFSGRDKESGPALARSLSGSDWVIRKSLPEVGFSSLELTHPWSVTSVAGINQASLAGCWVPASGGLSASAGAHPPAQLLMQECLQRFVDIEACIDWCSHRPASGRASLFLADSEGGRVRIQFDGEDVSVVRETEEICILGDSGTSDQVLKDSLLDKSTPDEAKLKATFEQRSASAYVRLLCGQRRLEVRNLLRPAEILSLELEGEGHGQPG